MSAPAIVCSIAVDDGRRLAVAVLVTPITRRSGRRGIGHPRAHPSSGGSRRGAAVSWSPFSGWLVRRWSSASDVDGGRVWQRRDRRLETDVERTDAFASWIENLRDVLIAGDQPIGAINATVVHVRAVD